MSASNRILYLHWNAAEAPLRAERLEMMGFEVEWKAEIDQRLAKIRAHPPRLVVIDLERLPSHGREAGMALRSYKDTRIIPILFLGGSADKVERVRESLPDAHYCGWEEAGGMIAELLANPPAAPKPAASVMEAYSGAPLSRKLGIKPGMAVLLKGGPEDFSLRFQDGPADVRWVRDGEAFHGGLVLWFVNSRMELIAGWNQVVRYVGKDGLWVIWPKKASGIKTDLKQQAVREIGLGAGLVDFKVCAVDEVWSGLKFARRK